MTIKMDPRSFVIGALAGVIVLMAIGAAGRDQDAPGDTSDSFKERLSAVEQRLFQRLTAPMPGRFRVDVSEEYAVIVDTATGQAWKHSLVGGVSAELCQPKLKPAGN